MAKKGKPKISKVKRNNQTTNKMKKTRKVETSEAQAKGTKAKTTYKARSGIQ